MSETATMTLTEFILARVAEDEAAAREEHEDGYGRYGHPFSAARVLAECEAKRRIVERADLLTDDSGLQDIGWEILGTLVLPYADHPDYRDEWKP